MNRKQQRTLEKRREGEQMARIALSKNTWGKREGGRDVYYSVAAHRIAGETLAAGTHSFLILLFTVYI